MGVITDSIPASSQEIVAFEIANPKKATSEVAVDQGWKKTWRWKSVQSTRQIYIPPSPHTMFEILEIVKLLDYEKSKQRFHKIIIGARGDNISKLRELFPSVNISFPEQVPTSAPRGGFLPVM